MKQRLDAKINDLKTLKVNLQDLTIGVKERI